MAVAPSPINAAHLNPRRAPSLRIVMLIGPTGMDNTKPEISPVRAATRMGGRSSIISVGAEGTQARTCMTEPQCHALQFPSRPAGPLVSLQNLVPGGHALCGTRAIFVIVFFLNFPA